MIIWIVFDSKIVAFPCYVKAVGMESIWMPHLYAYYCNGWAWKKDQLNSRCNPMYLEGIWMVFESVERTE
jgi:hypothetical protein